MSTHECQRCGEDFHRAARSGRIPQRCPPCRDEHNREYMRDFMRRKSERLRGEVRAVVKKKPPERNGRASRTKRKTDAAAEKKYLDNVPSADDILRPRFHDNGSGIDRGCWES